MNSINDHILALVAKTIGGSATKAERRELEQWKESSAANRREYEDLMKAAEGAGTVLGSRVQIDLEWEKFRARHFEERSRQPRILRLNSFLKYAAVFVLFLGLLWTGIYFSGSDVYRSGEGERMVVELSDNSKVILGENSHLTVGRLFNGFEREVNLHGTAFFDVAPNPKRPFTILGHTSVVKVLGTSFRYTTLEHKNQIDVTEGKVAFWQIGTPDTLKLVAGETGKVEDGLLLREASAAAGQSWVSGNFTFDNARLWDILNELQDYYHFNLSNPAGVRESNCRFSGSFKEQTLVEILDELALTLDFTYTLQDTNLLISLLKC